MFSGEASARASASGSNDRPVAVGVALPHPPPHQIPVAVAIPPAPPLPGHQPFPLPPQVVHDDHRLLRLAVESEFGGVRFSDEARSLLCVANVEACEYEDEERRPGVDLVAVLDTSSSMEGSNMAMVHNTLSLMIDHLSSRDRLGIVTYDTAARTVLPLLHMDAANKARARAAVGQTKAQGQTNLSGGLLLGLDLLEELRGERNPVSSVLLMTDGLANRGITDRDKLLSITQKFVGSLPMPTTLYSFGFGPEHDDKLLSQLSAAGGGTYYFIETTESIPEAFGACVGGLMSVVAQNIVLSATALEGVHIRAVRTGFGVEEVSSGQEYSVRVGDILAEERKSVVLELDVGAVRLPMEVQPLVRFSVKCFNVIASAQTRLQATANVRRTLPSFPARTLPSALVDEQRNRIRVAEALSQAQQLGDQGHLPQARAVLQQCQAAVAQSPSHERSHGLMADLEACGRGMASMSLYESHGSKKLRAKSRKHWVQRQAECEEGESDMYANKAHHAARAKWSFK